MKRYASRFSAMIVLLLGMSVLFSGCLKTRITTDKAPSTQKAEIEWAHGFVLGLVPPVNAPLNAEDTCGEAGVSEVYFRQTFIQGLAQGLTQSIYTPQRFTATCAAGEGMAATPSLPAYLLRDKQSPHVETSSAQPSATSASELK